MRSWLLLICAPVREIIHIIFERSESQKFTRSPTSTGPTFELGEAGGPIEAADPRHPNEKTTYTKNSFFIYAFHQYAQLTTELHW